jgi:hypothetical protein
MGKLTIFLTILFLFSLFIPGDSFTDEQSSDSPPKNYFKFDNDSDADTADDNNEVYLYPDPLTPSLRPSQRQLTSQEQQQKQPNPFRRDEMATIKPPGSYQIKARYAVVCLRNESGINIVYCYKWGDEKWRDDTLSENDHWSYFMEYGEGSRTSPNFFVKFDTDLSSRTKYIEKQLGRYASNKKLCDYGRKYYFMKEGNILSLIEK